MEELWAGFGTQKEKLEGEYQKQVNNIFFFGYRCCMKKHGITQDTPNYYLDNEKTIADDPTWEGGDIAAISPSSGQT